MTVFSPSMEGSRTRAGTPAEPKWRMVAAATTCLVAGLGLLTAPVGGQERDSGRYHELLIEALDETGGVITGAVADGVEVFGDGEEVAATDLGEVGNRWRIVLYFDQLLSSSTDFHNATIQLGERARELARLGSVEIMLAGQEVSTALPQSREPDSLSQALGWIRLRDTSEDLQAKLRHSFIERMGLEAEASGRSTAIEVEELVGTYLVDEAEILRRYREQLMLWAASHASPGPKALFLIGSGFDEEPVRFYQDALATAGWAAIARELEPLAVTPTVAELGQVLSVFGWTVLPYTPAQRGDALLEETEEELTARREEEVVDVVMQDGKVVDRTTIGFDPAELLKRRRERREAAAERPVLLDPEAPLRRLADSTGGEMLRGKFQLSDLLARLPQRTRLQVDLGPAAPDGVAEVVTRVDHGRAGEVPIPAILRARRWLAQDTPEAISAVRARRILDEQLDEGELEIAAALQPAGDGGGSRLIVKRDGLLASGDDAKRLRITLALGDEETAPVIDHRSLPGWQMLPAGDPDAEPTLELPFAGISEGVLVVVVEELETGLWGATFASFVEAAGIATSRSGFDTLLLPAPQVVHLMAPAQGFAMGPTEFETVVSDADVAQVEFWVDGVRKSVSSTPPFAATLDMGNLPQPRRVEAVAVDAAGAELGRDYLIVNEGSGVFGVRIVEPRIETQTGKPRRLVGAVDVEAEVEPRRGEGVDRVEFYWIDTLVATRYARPFRQRVVIPEDDPVGFLRVVAYLEDGNSSEDVLFVNSEGPSERLQVNLMELYVVVTDRHGRPVRGLDRDIFRVEEDGIAQEVATFSDAGNLPLTVGMVIDSSASMFVKLPDVQFAASEFLRGLATRRDRAFVVGFGNEPQLTRATTSDLPAIIRSLDHLQPVGQTAIWKAVVYSLVQLQGVPGKKALIVYTDGADEDPDFSFRTCLRFAQKVGVPIYVILSNNEIRRTEGKGLQVKGFLERLEALTESVGGRIFLARIGQDLQGVYKEIDEELRSQYVLGYYSEDLGGSDWRSVQVDVDRAGLKARTIAGYYR